MTVKWRVWKKIKLKYNKFIVYTRIVHHKCKYITRFLLVSHFSVCFCCSFFFDFCRCERCCSIMWLWNWISTHLFELQDDNTYVDEGVRAHIFGVNKNKHKNNVVQHTAPHIFDSLMQLCSRRLHALFASALLREKSSGSYTFVAYLHNIFVCFSIALCVSIWCVCVTCVY